MTMESTEEAQLTPPKAESAPPADVGAGRAVAAVAYVAGVLILFGLLALVFTWVPTNLWGIVILLGVAGALTLVMSWATRRLRPQAVSDVLAGIAAVSLTLSLDTVFDASGVVVGPAERWIMLCAPAVLLGGAFWWWFSSRLAGAWAVIGFSLLPLALATGGEKQLGFTIPLTVDASEISVWTALALMAMIVTVVERGTQIAVRRGKVAPSTAVWTSFIATTTLGMALVIGAMVQGQSWFYFVLVAVSAALTGFSIWQGEWVWMPTAARLFSTAGITALGGIDDGPGRAMGFVILLLSFFTFAPLARRLPNHLSVRFWEGTLWFIGCCVSCAFAFEPGGWPAVGGLWAAAVIVLAAVQRRTLAMVFAVVSLYVVFIVRVIDAFGANAGVGFGTIFFGITLLVAVVIWREQFASALVKVRPFNSARLRLRY